MIVLYTVVFRRLRERERARLLLQMNKHKKMGGGGGGKNVNIALAGGAKMFQNLGYHFKMQSDKMMLEISLQVCLFLIPLKNNIILPFFTDISTDVLNDGHHRPDNSSAPSQQRTAAEK